MPEELTLVAEPNREAGSRASRRLRRAGSIPGVLYGHGMEPVPLSVNGRELRRVLNTEAGLNALVTLDVAGSKQLALAKQLQRDPVRGTVIHVDWIAVRRDEVVSAEVPVHLVGEASEAQRDGGVLTHELTNLTVSAKASEVPHAIEVDVTSLQVGDVVRVGDLKLPAGVTTDVDPELPVLSVTSATVVPEVAAEEEGAEAESGEAVTAERDTETAEAEAAGDTTAGGDAAE